MKKFIDYVGNDFFDIKKYQSLKKTLSYIKQLEEGTFKTALGSNTTKLVDRYFCYNDETSTYDLEVSVSNLSKEQLKKQINQKKIEFRKVPILIFEEVVVSYDYEKIKDNFEKDMNNFFSAYQHKIIRIMNDKEIPNYIKNNIIHKIIHSYLKRLRLYQIILNTLLYNHKALETQSDYFKNNLFGRALSKHGNIEYKQFGGVF